jgi:Pyruvate/2-oxoacid:ferredoxin oxidoreductase delta subunit
MEKRKIKSVRQLPVMPLTIQDMTWNKTGAWRLLTPKVQEKTAPCRAACPIGQPIPDFIHAVSERDWNGALELLLEVNPLPGVTARLCYHPCRAQCLRKEFDRPISVNELEKLVADFGTTTKVVRKAPNGRKVAVCGAGPAGLTAAYHLALQGCQVSLLDPSDQAGGFLRNAKSEKLPAEVLAREINRLVAISGVLLRMNAVGPVSEEFDLTIVDRSAYQPGSEEALAVEALANAEGSRLNIETQKGTAGLKPVQVAHAVAWGRRIASDAGQQLNLNGGRTKEEMGQVVSKEDIKFHLLPDRISADALPPAEDATEEVPILEAKRCLSCGTCNLCQSCALACPDASCQLDERGGRIVIDLYHCKGCGICAHECPRSVLVMEAL